MFILGFNEFIRNIRRNILVIAQMVVVYVIAIFVVSAFMEQYRLIDGISRVFDDTGVFVDSVAIGGTELNFVEESVLKDILVKVENVEHTLAGTLSDTNSSLVSEINISACNPEFITYVPELLEGQWCEEAPHEDGVINAVASDNFPFKTEVGQKIEYAGYCFKITGIVSSNEMIYGINTSLVVNEASYLDYFDSVKEREKVAPYRLLLVSYEDWARERPLHDKDMGEYSNNMDISSLWGAFVTIDFEDDITEEEMDYNIQQLNSHYGYELGRDLIKTDSMYEYSWKLIEIKVMPMIMLLAVVIIVLMVSLVISGAINVLYEKRNYGVYFICGNDWRNTFKFSAVSWTILSFASLITGGCACVLIYSLKLVEGLSLSFTWIHIVALAAITVILLLITIFIPFTMLRKIQPVSILKENDK